MASMPMIIDVRTRAEYNARHVEGAINVDYRDPSFAREIAEFPRDAQYIVYCNAGGRGGRAADFMKAHGFTDVRGYGIMGASVASGAPVVYGS